MVMLMLWISSITKLAGPNTCSTFSDVTNQAPKTKQNPTQGSSFVELLNIIDTQTRDGAYLSIQDIENTYVSMLHLGGTEALENHSPAFTRQWLKDRILSELTHVKTVRQRKCEVPLSCSVQRPVMQTCSRLLSELQMTLKA